MLMEKLKQDRIQMTDGSNSPLRLRPNDGVIHTKDKPPSTVNRADVSICYGKYVRTEGQHAVLDCVVSASPEATTVTWVRRVKGSELTIQIDNQKYIGASVDAPSLIIADLTTEDQGAYYCKVHNGIGVAESNTTMLHVTRLKSRSIQTTIRSLSKVRESINKGLHINAETAEMCKTMYSIQEGQQQHLDNKLYVLVFGSLCVTLLFLSIYFPSSLLIVGYTISVPLAISKIMGERTKRNYEVKERLLQANFKELLTGITEFIRSVSEMEIGKNDLLSDDTLLDIVLELSTKMAAKHNNYMKERSEARQYLNMLQDLQRISNLLNVCLEQMERWVDGYGDLLIDDTM